MSDRGASTSDRSVVCPRCGARTRQGITPLGRVCVECSRRVFAVPSRQPGTPRSEDPWSVIAPIFAVGVLIAVTWALAADGLSSFDPVVVVAAWGTFVVWALSPYGPSGHSWRWLDGIRT